MLLAAWPAIAARVPGASLEVIGSSRPGSAPPGVTYRGRVGDDTKRRVMGSAEVLAAPNTAGESFGIVLVEGMASRCALVASALPGFVHVGGDAARWVAPGDAPALADAVAGLLSDPVTRGALVERGSSGSPASTAARCSPGTWRPTSTPWVIEPEQATLVSVEVDAAEVAW